MGWAAPDCQYSFHFTNRTGEQTDGITQISGAASTPAINNKDNACIGWTLSYDVEGFSAISLNLQTAPNVINSPNIISQGTWSTFTGTNVSGSLPLTTTSSGIYVGYAYFPWIRVNLASATGTGSINVRLSGWKSVAYVAGLSGAGGSALAIQNDGVATGSEAILNFGTGVGIVWTGVDAAGKITETLAIDPSYTLSRLTDQAGTDKYCNSSTGTAVGTCTLTPTLTAYTTGMCLHMLSTTNNTTTFTINVDTLGAKSVLGQKGGALAAADITANQLVVICYNGTAFNLQ